MRKVKPILNLRAIPRSNPTPASCPVPDPICPGTLPSGTCVSDSLHCSYDNAMGCPVLAVCLSFGGADLYWDTLPPPPVGTCSTPGKICEYETGREGVPQRQALRCGDSLKWEQHDLCPAETPTSGASCDHPNLHCDYGHCPSNGIPVASAECRGSQGDAQSAVWSVNTFCSPADGG